MFEQDIPERILAQLGPMQRIHMVHEEVIEKMALAGDAVPKGRGVVIPLTDSQRWTRLLYLGKLVSASALDKYVREANPDMADDTMCADIYYLLKDHNGGKSPTARDPADRWTAPGGKQVNRTCDCIGGQAWVGGWDRYQPLRFSHLYDGWINTDSMIMDVRGERKCFTPLQGPAPGAYVVCMSGSPGHRIGHIGGIIECPEKFDIHNREHWKATKIVDCSYQGDKPCNLVRTMEGWFGTGAEFVVPNMVP